MAGVFWASTFVIVYIYLGYPLLLATRARIAPRPVRKAPVDWSGTWPSISIVLAARNEASRLPARLSNLLELTYPGPRQVVGVSDGSTDGTLAAVTDFIRNHGSPSSVRIIEVPAGGKPLALNAGVRGASGDILVFADAPSASPRLRSSSSWRTLPIHWSEVSLAS